MNPHGADPFRAARSELGPVRTLAVVFVATALTFSSARAQATYVWNGSNGNWATPANWTPVGVPGVGDTAVIQGGEVQLTANQSVGTLQMAGGSLAGDNAKALEVQSGANWSGGTIRNLHVAFIPGCEWEIGSSSVKSLHSGSITNAGVLKWTGGTLSLQNGALFENRADGLLEVRFDGELSQLGPGGTTFRNSGTYQKSQGSGTNLIRIPDFFNLGTVHCRSGVIHFAAPGANLQATAPLNHFEADDGATILFSQPAQFGSSTFAGEGPKIIAAGASQIAMHGVISANGLVLASGSLGGTFRLEGRMEWTGGALSGQAVITSGSVLQLTGAGSKSVGAGSIRNSGTIEWRGGDWLIENNSEIWNLADGLIEVHGDLGLLQNGGATSVLNNEGTYRKISGAGTNTITLLSVINTGQLQSQAGTVAFAQPGASMSSTGTRNALGAGPDAALIIHGNATFTDTRFEGPGVKKVDAAERLVNLEGVLECANLVIAAGNIRAATTTKGTVEWRGGTVGGTWTNAPGAILAVTGPAGTGLFVGTLSNHGLVTISEGGLALENNSSLLNQSDGLLELLGNGPLQQSGGGNSAFVNLGTCRKSAGTGLSTINVPNIQLPGTLEVLTGILRIARNPSGATAGVLKVRIGGPVAGVDHGQLQVAGPWTVGGLLLVEPAAAFDPPLGQTYDIVTAGTRTGTFTQVLGGALGGGHYLTPNYDAKGVRLAAVDATPRFTGYSPKASGFQIDFTGVAGSNYRIDASTNLVEWTILATNGIPGSGFTSYLDTDLATIPNRFYRAEFLP